jgi:hypothetical protein
MDLVHPGDFQIDHSSRMKAAQGLQDGSPGVSEMFEDGGGKKKSETVIQKRHLVGVANNLDSVLAVGIEADHSSQGAGPLRAEVEPWLGSFRVESL